MSKYFAESELIINEDGSCFHLHLRPEQLADKVILVGDPGRVSLVASHFEEKECEVESREFRAITGTYTGHGDQVTLTIMGQATTLDYRIDGDVLTLTGNNVDDVLRRVTGATP